VESFYQTLDQYGADPAAVRSFESDGPDLLPYATLVAARAADDPVLSALRAVYEWQNQPLAFLVDGERLAREQDVQGIRRRLAMRGDAPYLAIVRPGQLTVYRISLDGDPPDRTRIDINIPINAERIAFPQLANYRPGISGDPRRWISNIVLKLLDDSIERLKSQSGVAGEDAISLVGRALFTRFLGDRGLLPSSLIPGGHAETAGLFDDPERAAATSHWLDETLMATFCQCARIYCDQFRRTRS